MSFFEYIDHLNTKEIAVIGAGVSNQPLIALLCEHGCHVTVCDMRTEEDMGELAVKLKQQGAVLKLGKSYLENLDGFDLIFRTPGLLPLNEHLVKAKNAGVEITSEMELFFRFCPCKIVAITGSDGKTTTSSIIAELLRASGKTVHLGGNIGRPLLCDIPEMKESDICVLELSSFQLHSMYCKPDVAVVTNVSPNHLDVHPDFEDYMVSKKNIFLQQDENCLLVLNADNEITNGFDCDAKAQVLKFSRQGKVHAGAYYADGKIWKSDGGEVIDIDEIKIPGMHNVENYMAAYCAVGAMVGDEVFREVARTFSGVQHRLELIREHKGVKYINDSIASSPTRAVAGLRSFKDSDSIILIAGGHDKHVPFDEMADEVCKRCKALFLCGESAEAIAKAVRASSYYTAAFPMFINENWTENVMAASAYAKDGDTVLLSPACSSFDFFKNFAERGNLFREIVMELE